MKTRAVSLLSVIFTVLLNLPLLSNAQSDPERLDKNFKWNGESKSETFHYVVKDECAQMMINIDGSAKEGKLEVTLYNPDGEKFPGFILISDGSSEAGTSVVNVTTESGTNTVSTTSSSTTSASSSTSSSSNNTSSTGTSINSNNKGAYTYTTSSSPGSGAKGVMNKILSDPMPGKWKFEISGKKLQGELNLSISQD